jgi:antitoxin FitA
MHARSFKLPTLQVRDLPEDVYVRLSAIANEENRSLAQQTIVLLKESLGLHTNNKIRRKRILASIEEKRYKDIRSIDPVELIREDRER